MEKPSTFTRAGTYCPAKVVHRAMLVYYEVFHNIGGGCCQKKIISVEMAVENRVDSKK